MARRSWWGQTAGRGPFRRGDWAFVAAVAVAIVIVNRAVIHDEGNTWGGLVISALIPGLTLVALNRWRLERALHKRRMG